MRYTNKQVANIVDCFMKEFEIDQAKSYKDIGGYRLDYNSIYGGYVITMIDNDGGGISHPFGCTRRSARELVDVISFARYVRLLKAGRGG